MNLTRALLYTNLFFLQSYLLRFNLGVYPTNLQEILILITSIFFLRDLWKKKYSFKFKNHTVLITLLILSGVSFIANDVLSNIDLLRHLKFLFFAGVLVTMFLEVFTTKSEQKKAIRIMGYGAITFGIFSLIYNLLGYNVAHDYRLLGPLDSAVYLAYYLTPFAIFFFLEKKWIEGLILVLLIIATRSMGAIGGLFIIITLANFKKIDKRLLAGIGLLILGAIFYTKILPTLQTNYSSLDERGEIWTVAFTLLKSPDTILTGVGLSQFEAHYIKAAEAVLGAKPLDFHVIQPHNIFLLFIFHYGVLGGVFLIFCLHQIITKPKSIFSWMLIYFFIHGLIDTPIYKNDLLFIFILLLSLTIKIPYFKPETKSIKTA